jgi:hypothetical protein
MQGKVGSFGFIRKVFLSNFSQELEKYAWRCERKVVCRCTTLCAMSPYSMCTTKHVVFAYAQRAWMEYFEFAEEESDIWGFFHLEEEKFK